MDPTWQGIERLPELSDKVQRRWPRIHGPLTGRVGVWLAIAPVLNTTGALFSAVERTEPAHATLARAGHRRYQERAALPGSAVQALEDAWDLLPTASG